MTKCKLMAPVTQPQPFPMMPKEQEPPLLTRVVHARLPEKLWLALESLSRHVKDLRNTIIHLALTVLFGFGFGFGFGLSTELRQTWLKEQKEWPGGEAKDRLKLFSNFEHEGSAPHAARTTIARIQQERA